METEEKDRGEARMKSLTPAKDLPLGRTLKKSIMNQFKISNQYIEGDF